MSADSKIVLLAGQKNVGKSTSAGYLSSMLQKRGYRTERLAFARPLKDFVVNTLGYQHEQIFGTNEQKDTPGPWNWEELNPHLRHPHRTGPISGRQMLQVLGSDVFRNAFSVNVWTKAAQAAVIRSEADVIIFDDVRMMNECEVFPNTRRILIRRYDGSPRDKDGHITENSLNHLADDYWDEIIDNNGTMTNLFEALDYIIKTHFPYAR